MALKIKTMFANIQAKNMKFLNTTWVVHIFSRVSRKDFDERIDDLFSCSCFKSWSELTECISEFIMSMAEYVTARSLRLKAATTFVPMISRKLEGSATLKIVLLNGNKIILPSEIGKGCVAHFAGQQTRKCMEYSLQLQVT